MEEYINLYHQKLWEIAFANVEKVFGIFFIIWLVLSIYPVYISFHNLVRRKKLVLLLVCMPFLLFFLCMGTEYVYSYDKIMNPNSPYNDSLRISVLKSEKVLPVLENVDEISIASVDGDLKRKDIILFAVPNPTFYDGLFGNVANHLAGGQTVGTDFVVALVDFKENKGEWQSVDIRIAPGVEKSDFQKFSKVLHIERGEKEGAEGIILNLQTLHESTLRKEKNGE